MSRQSNSNHSNDKWHTSEVSCKVCFHVWVAVAPVIADYLECPLCHHMNPAPVAPIDDE